MAEGSAAARAALWCWRHPRARHADGRCIGRTDLAVDPRRAKRLAHRIRHAARRHGLPRVAWVSPLTRARAVGGWLRRWGWRVETDARLAELDFGAWDGRPWSEIPWSEVEAWRADLLHCAPGGGETLAQLALRVQAFEADAGSADGGPRLVVGHAGWINAWLVVAPGCTRLEAADWPPPPPHGALRRRAAGG
jgi:alpha-ribazole phosphatase